MADQAKNLIFFLMQHVFTKNLLYISYCRTHNLKEMLTNVNCELWVTMLRHCGSLHYNKCTALVGNAGSGRRHACVGEGVDEKPLDLLLNVAVRLEMNTNNNHD